MIPTFRNIPLLKFALLKKVHNDVKTIPLRSNKSGYPSMFGYKIRHTFNTSYVMKL